MGGIFGYVDFDDRRVDDGALAAMRRAMAHWGRDGHAEVGDSPALLGRCRSFDTPEAVFDRMPHPVNGGSALMTAEARLDNRDELCDALGVAHVDRPMLADTDVIARAYERWGEACASHLHGDWSVAVWDRRTRKAWVARDQHGMTALYYFHDGTRFAFASDKRALLPLLRRGPSLDEEFLAEILIAWPAGHGDKTTYREIRRLCPAHTIEASGVGVTVREYWWLDNAPDVRLASVTDYAEAVMASLTRATRVRLRSQRQAAISLSGGLDSGTVAVVAAPILAERGASLVAYTSVPLFDAIPGTDLVGDEFANARRAIERFPNVEHVAIRAEAFSPIRGIREMLETHGEPGMAPGNQYWLNAINHAARDRGVGVLLTGQHGNGTISWSGIATLSSAVAVLRASSARAAAYELLQAVRPWLPRSWNRQWRPWSFLRSERAWGSYSAIAPQLAVRLKLSERRSAAGHSTGDEFRVRSGRQMRLRYVRPGMDASGARRAHVGAAFGFTPADPTRDVQLMELLQGVPDWVFRGPRDRWLVRQMTIGRLPGDLRLQGAGGQQAADLLGRLRSHADEQSALIQDISASPICNELLDIQFVTRLHRQVVASDRRDQLLLQQSQSALMSALSLGAFVCRLDGGFGVAG